jgi:two-component system, chemotaxis family, CheB/CheR fusion protein
VVGIGSSAGGLEALEQFFSALPGDTGMAFVLVSHLDPNRTSLLPDLLRKRTPMPVFQATDRKEIQPNTVYVIPPKKDITLEGRVLRTRDRARTNGIKAPIDTFFRSLAREKRERSAGIVLSGTGTDGTLGLKEIKSEMGLVVIQEPRTAAYTGMPESAMASANADVVAPPAGMPARLINFFSKWGRSAMSRRPSAEVSSEGLREILKLLKNRTGHDFSLYKKNTIHRRIERRMAVHQLETVPEYLRYLQQTPTELDLLFKELLIGVTSFFRDPDAFNILRKKILKGVIKNKTRDESVRIWVPGCSTGEEVYSIAITLSEVAAEMNKRVKIQVFGTDIDKRAIDTARAGLYPAAIAHDVSRATLKRYFTNCLPS